METIPRKSTIRRIIIDPYEIHYLRFILEAYEGIGVVSTIDSALGLMQLNIAPGCEEDVERILADEASRLCLRRIHCADGSED